MNPLRVGYCPFNPGANPYQRLFAGSLEQAGVLVDRVPPRKLFPLHFAAARNVKLLQLDWPHDWYQGRNIWAHHIKRWMYRDGLRRLRQIPVVWTAHNLHGHNATDINDERRMIQALIDVCEGIIVLSNTAEELLRQEYWLAPQTRVRVIRHGHYMDCYPNEISRVDARKRLGIADQARVVLHLGRLQPYKGLEDLIPAFADVASKSDVLLLVGKSVSSSFTDQLRIRIAEVVPDGLQVELRDGLVSDDELQVYFNACDVVALPFRRVLNTGSLLLAMSFGCPVVAPSLGSIPEVVCPGGWFEYDPNQADGLSGALHRALHHDNLQEMRHLITQYTAEHYDWGRAGIAARDLYDAILG